MDAAILVLFIIITVGLTVIAYYRGIEVGTKRTSTNLANDAQAIAEARRVKPWIIE